MNLIRSRKCSSLRLTPLIDVVFLLLLFFMLTSHFHRWQQVEINTVKRESYHSNSPNLGNQSSLLNLQPNGNLIWKDHTFKVDNQTLIEQLKQWQDADNTIQLYAEDDVIIQLLVSTLTALKQNDINNVSLKP